MCDRFEHLVEVARMIGFAKVPNGISLPFGANTDRHLPAPVGTDI